MENDAPFAIACKFLEMQTGIFGRMKSARRDRSFVQGVVLQRTPQNSKCDEYLKWTSKGNGRFLCSFDQRTILVM